MSWPISQDYNEAIQSPETSFADPELKQGEVVCNALGIPLPRSGNFADVYEFRCANGSRWAIKCFTREVAGLRERYQEISRALQDAKLPFTVEFTYQQEGMLIRGQWYPILKMQWVEGLTFNDFVRQHLDKPAMLEGLLQIWSRMAQRLRAAGIAHADLQHGNVLLVPGRTDNAVAVKLIDYDGMFVPALAGKPSGEVGHPSYQHPQRVREGIYSAEVDRFPLLLIAAALRCVRVGGRALWERYDNGDNLLFREADLKGPEGSKLFGELEGLNDGKAKTLVGQVRQALTRSFDKVSLLEEVLPELTTSSVTTSAKAVRPTPQVAPSAAVQVNPPKAAPAPTAAEDDEENEDFDVDEPKRGRKRRAVKKGSGSLLLWVGGGVGAALLLLAGIAAILMMSGKLSLSNADNGQQAAVQPREPDAGGPTKPPVKDPGKVTPIKDPVKDPIKDPIKDPVKDPIKDPIKDPVKDPIKDPIKDPVKDPIKDPIKDPVKDPSGEDVFKRSHILNTATNINSLAISADGKLGISCSNTDGTINQWDLDTGEMKELKTPYSTVAGLAFLPGYKAFLYSANDGKLHGWEFDKPVQRNNGLGLPAPEGHIGAVNDLDVTADGKIAVTACADKLRGWDLDTGKRLPGEWPKLEMETSVVRLSGNGRYFVTYHSNNRCIVWDVKSGSGRMFFNDLKGGGPLRAITISNDGELVATGSYDGMVMLHEVNTNRSPLRHVAFLTKDVSVKALAFSPDAQFIAVAADGPKGRFLVIYDVAAGLEVQRFEDTPVQANLLKFAADSTRLIAAGDDHKLRVYDLVNGARAPVARNFRNPGPGITLKELAAQPVSQTVRAMAVGKDGTFVTGHEDGSVHVWTTAGESLKNTSTIADPDRVAVAKMRVAGNKCLVALQNGVVQIVDLNTGKRRVVSDLRTDENKVHVQDIDISDDGRRAFVCASIMTPAGSGWRGGPPGLTFFDLKNDNGPVTQAGFIQSWSGTTRFTPGGKQLVRMFAGAETAISIWDGDATRQETRIFGQKGSSNILVVSMDGRQAVTGSPVSTLTRVWNLRKEESYTLINKTSPVSDLSISPSGRLGYSRSGIGAYSNFLLWDMDTGRELGSQPAGNAFRAMHSALIDENLLAMVTDTNQLKLVRIDFKKTVADNQTPPPKDPPKDPVKPVVTKKTPIPAAEVAQAERTKVREGDTYKGDYGKTKGGNIREMRALADRLLTDAKRVKDDPVHRYALLSEALKLAGPGCDPGLVIMTVDEMAGDFDINARAMKAATLIEVGKAASTGAEATATLKAALPVLEEALQEDDFETVAAAVTAVQTASNSGAEGKKQALERTAFALRMRKAHDAIGKELETLKENPKDPAANLAVGRYYCFYKMEWEKGLPLLAIGGDAEMVTTIQKDQAAAGNTASSEVRLEAAEAWTHLVAASDAELRPAMQRRAFHWYGLAMPDLSRAEVRRVDKLVADLSRAHPEFVTGWDHVEYSPAASNLGGYVRLAAGQTLNSRIPLKGPVEITAVVRSSDGQLQFDAYRDIHKLFSVKPALGGNNTPMLSWDREPGTGPGTQAGSRFLNRSVKQDEWVKISIIVKDDGMEVALVGPGNVPPRILRTLDLSKPAKSGLKAMGDLEIRSFEVKSGTRP